MNIRVHIERLVLDGLDVSASEGEQVQAGAQSELARLLETGGLAPELMAGTNLAAVPAGNLGVGREQNGRLLGRQIAHSVYEGIGTTGGKR
jgi:hypothetical protein